MQLYSNKLFWQSGPEEMKVLDIDGHSLARMVVDTPGKRFTRFAIKHPSMFRYPGETLLYLYKCLLCILFLWKSTSVELVSIQMAFC